MNKQIHSFFSFLLIIFIVNLSFFVCENSLMDYFNGEEDEITANKEGEYHEQNNCLCDTDPRICDEFCCCDEECPKDAIEEWRNHSKCIDEKDTVLNFADRCIDKNLVFRYNKQRGLRNATQTEDISKKEGEIVNYCYSMDNARKEISDSTSSTNDTERKNIISKKIDELFFNDNNEYSKNEESDGTDEDYITIKKKESTRSLDDDDELFMKSGKFSLFSGVICSNTKNIEFLVPENHTCLKEKDDKIKNFLNNINNIILEVDDIEYTFQEIKSYEYRDDGLLEVGTKKSYNNAECILEVEFVVNLKQTKKGFINIVFTDKGISSNNYYTFKNSISFTNDEKLPYRYSGNGGYINGLPLKICYSDSDNAQKKIFNEYYIVGRDKAGNCRFDPNINNYLYYYDAPILFNKNFTYSCKNDQNQKLVETTLFKKINNIEYVAKYGSSSYKSIDNNPDWIPVNLTSFSNDCNTISMNIFIGTNVTGIYSHKYVYEVDISCKEKGDTDNFKLEVLYFDLEANHIYDKEPDIPTFVPRIPDDLLDPLFYSEVDK